MTIIAEKIVANPNITSFGDVSTLAAPSLFSSLSVFASVGLRVASSASVSPADFKQVNRASGSLIRDELDPLRGKKTVRMGVML